MSFDYNKLKIVVLECPYDTWDIAPTQELFGKMVSVKLAGYRARHPYGVMPVDVYDYVAIHQLVCMETSGGFQVLTGYKTISYERCKTHRVPFPMLSILGEGNAKPHEAYVHSVINRCDATGGSLAYSGSWTIDPKLRGDRELIHTLRSVFEAMYVFCHRDYGFKEIVCGGVPRLKTDLLFEEWGHDRVRVDGKLLPNVSVPHLQGDEVALMHLKEFSRSVRTRAEKWSELWADRLLISPNTAQVLPFRKVA